MQKSLPMKNILLIIFCFLSFATIYAQEEELTKEEKERREKNIQAGNPFTEFGYKAKVATLSKGKYLEVHDLDSIVKIGTSLWHVRKQKIVGNVEQDSTDMYRQPLFETAGRWLSPDPLAEEFPEWSPYNYTMNNPIRFTDPTGLAPEDWRNSDGNLIYDPKANGGKGAYTEYATQNDKNIGNALQSTKTGKEQFSKLVNSVQPTEIVLNSGEGPKGEAGNTDNGKPGLYMDMQTGKVDGIEVEKSTITVFMGTIGALADAESQGYVGKLNGTSVEGLSFDQIIAAVVGHEIEHIQTDNIILQETGATLKQIEEKPTTVSNKIIRESRDLDKKP